MRRSEESNWLQLEVLPLRLFSPKRFPSNCQGELEFGLWDARSMFFIKGFYEQFLEGTRHFGDGSETPSENGTFTFNKISLGTNLDLN